MKARSDATLKSRALQSHEFGDRVFNWCEEPAGDDHTGGYKYAKGKLDAEGIKTSVGALSEFYSWWGLRKSYEQAADHAREQKGLMLEFDPNDVERAEKFGDFVFLQQAVALKDPKTFVALGSLRETRKMRELKEKTEPRKLEIAERRIRVLEQNIAKAQEKITKTLDKAEKKGGITTETRQLIDQELGAIA